MFSVSQIQITTKKQKQNRFCYNDFNLKHIYILKIDSYSVIMVNTMIY